MFKKSIFIIPAVLLVVLLSGAGCGGTIYDGMNNGSTSGGQVNGGTTSQIDENELIGEDPHYRGPQEAKVTIVELADFECPACASTAPNIKKMLEKYPNDVRLVYRHFPLSYHKNAKMAAYAFEAAAHQGKTWEMYDLLFENSSKLSDNIYEEFAKRLNLDLEKFKADMQSDEIKKIVDNDYNYGIKINLQGTPTFFINGEEFSNRPDVNGFSAEIDKILKK